MNWKDYSSLKSGSKVSFAKEKQTTREAVEEVTDDDGNVTTPAQHTPEIQEVAQKSSSKDVTGMKFTHSLIKHLDQLYSKMLAGEVKEIASEPQYDGKQKVIEGQTDSLLLNEKEAFYNPGNSAVTESM